MSEDQKAPVDQATSVLIRLGLVQPCRACPEPRKLVRELQGLSKQVHLSALREAAEPRGIATPCDLERDTLRVVCSACKNTGYLPTEAGRQLVAFVKLFFAESCPADYLTDEEIPF